MEPAAGPLHGQFTHTYWLVNVPQSAQWLPPQSTSHPTNNSSIKYYMLRLLCGGFIPNLGVLPCHRPSKGKWRPTSRCATAPQRVHLRLFHTTASTGTTWTLEITRVPLLVCTLTVLVVYETTGNGPIDFGSVLPSCGYFYHTNKPRWYEGQFKSFLAELNYLAIR